MLNKDWNGSNSMNLPSLTQFTAQKMNFSIKGFFSKFGPNPQETAELVTFTEEIFNAKVHFLCGDCKGSLKVVGMVIYSQ